MIFKRKKNHINIALVCDKGRVRDNNEDNLSFGTRILPLNHKGCGLKAFEMKESIPLCFGVFDGMGGETKGELASYIGAKIFAKLASKDQPSDDYLEQVFLEMNKEVFDASIKEKITQIGTTAATVVIDSGKAYAVNVGDSPIFMARNGLLEKVSESHTNEEFLKENGIVRKPELIQFLGMDYREAQIEPSIKEINLQRGDQLLICSDGLTDMVESEEIEEIVNEDKDIKKKVEILFNEALNNGGKDNITIILAEVL